MNTLDKQPTVLQHPAGLFILFFTEMWERFSYYGMRALLVLFLVSETAINGWEWPREDALNLYAFYTGLVYVTPIIGGIIADKILGYRKAVLIGAILMTLGHASMAMEMHFTFYMGLILLIMGNGFFKPNISSIVGGLYSKDSDKKDAAYTIFYMGINAGAFLGILLCGYMGEKVGWSYGFGLAGIFMFFGMLQFWFGQKIFGDIGLKPRKEDKEIQKESKKENDIPKHIVRDRLIVISIFAFFTIFFWMAFEQAGGSMTIFAKDYTQRVLTGAKAFLFNLINTILTVVPLLVISWVLILLFIKIIKKYFLSVLFLTISFVTIWFIALWMLNKEFNTYAYEIQYKSEKGELIRSNLRIDKELNKNEKIFAIKIDNEKLKYIDKDEKNNFKKVINATVIRKKTDEVEVPASWFGILNSFFIIFFAPLFSKLWESRLNPSGPVKFALGLILLGLGFAALAYGGKDIPQGAKTASVSMLWLVIAYLMHTLGELCLSPVGLSYVSKLSPSNMLGLIFGVWFGASAIANFLAGKSGSFIDKITNAYSISYFFLIYTVIPISAGIIMILISNFLRKKMHGIH